MKLNLCFEVHVFDNLFHLQKSSSCASSWSTTISTICHRVLDISHSIGKTTRLIILIVEMIGILLYESHSLIHLRLLPSKGRYFANIFIYFVSVRHSFKHFPDNTFQYDIDEIHKEAFSSQNHVMNTSSILFHRRRKSGG